MRWRVNKSKSKYKNVSAVRDGMRFDSKKEANFYDELKLRKQSGDVTFFLRQCPIHLTAGVKYVVDFVVFNSDGLVEFVDVKGIKTDVYKLKKKQVEELYPFEIKEMM